MTTLDQSALSSGSALSFGAPMPLAALATPAVAQVTVTVDGTPVPMYAVADRIAYPAGTCLEELIGIRNFANPASCTGMPGAITLILWQTSSAAQTPDRLLFVMADVNTSTFLDTSSDDGSMLTGGSFPAIAFYMERGGAMWVTSGGSLTSGVSPGGGSCTTSLPPFATAATCSTGSFTESGSMTFSPFEFSSATATGTHTVSLSAQTLNGMVQTVTATAPLHFPD
jgi:hypothetical protein